MEKNSTRLERVGRYLHANRYVYLLALLPLAYYIVFAYVPMYGVTIAFKDFKYNLGILGSPWAGLKHFERMFALTKFWQVLGNTLRISVLRLVVEFPMPILLALMLNELQSNPVKRVFQTVYTFPNFISWIVISGIIFSFFNSEGLVNQALMAMGGEKQHVLTSPGSFLALLLASNVWKTAGWSSIVYLSALASIDPTLYEAALVDGAGRFRRLIHITLPGISSTIVIMLILAVGGVMNAGFDQVFNLYNSTVFSTADILDTYVYRLSFEEAGNFSFSTAVGLFKSVVNMVLLVSVNKLAHMMGQQGIY